MQWFIWFKLFSLFPDGLELISLNVEFLGFVYMTMILNVLPLNIHSLTVHNYFLPQVIIYCLHISLRKNNLPLNFMELLLFSSQILGPLSTWRLCPFSLYIMTLKGQIQIKDSQMNIQMRYKSIRTCVEVLSDGQTIRGESRLLCGSSAHWRGRPPPSDVVHLTWRTLRPDTLQAAVAQVPAWYCEDPRTGYSGNSRSAGPGCPRPPGRRL